MNWSYLAGFFDGEGSLCKNAGQYGNGSNGSLSYTVSIPQAESRKKILDEIRDFLAFHKIVAPIRVRNGGRQVSPRHEVMWVMHITGRDNLVRFLTGIIPYVIGKKANVQDTLRFLKIYPSLKGLTPKIRVKTKLTDEQVRQIRAEKSAGASGVQLGKKYGVCSSHIYSVIHNKYLRKIA